MANGKEKIHLPPPPSTPKAAPWTEVEEIIEALRDVASKLDAFIAALRGITPGVAVPGVPGAPGVPGVTVVDLSTISNQLNTLLEILKNRTGWVNGQTRVPTPGTAVHLPDTRIPHGFELVVQAMRDNTKDVYVGYTTAAASRPLERKTLSPGDGIELRITNANLVWVDAAVANEGVEYFVEV